MKPTIDKKTIIISLGGSLIVPEEIDCEFIKNFKAFIERKIEKGYKFIIVSGGGKLARKYILAADKISEISNEDKDWLGIRATRMNAHFLRTILKKHAYPQIIGEPTKTEDFCHSKKSVLIASGWQPGNSTNLIAILIAKQLKINEVVSLSSIDYVYDKDPTESFTAERVENISWKEFRKMIGDIWKPGMNVPFDPIASKAAEENGISVVIMNGKEMDNLKKHLNGEKFKGTTIK